MFSRSRRRPAAGAGVRIIRAHMAKQRVHANHSRTWVFVYLYFRFNNSLQHPALPPDLPFGEQDLLLVACDGLLDRLEDLLRGRRQPLVNEHSEQLDAGHDASGTAAVFFSRTDRYPLFFSPHTLLLLWKRQNDVQRLTAVKLARVFSKHALFPAWCCSCQIKSITSS